MKPQHIITWLGLCVCSLAVQAELLCARNTAELRAALSTAEANLQADEIRLETGWYETNGSHFDYLETDGMDLTISGGWTTFNGSPCARRQTLSAFMTVLDGQMTSRVMRITLSQDASLFVDGLSFINGLDLNGRGAGLDVSKLNNLNTGEMVFDRVIFVNNEAQFGGALSLSGAARINVMNALIYQNHATVTGNVEIIMNDADGIYFHNNTVLQNTIDGTAWNHTGGVLLSGSGSTQLLIANNVLRDNDQFDLRATATAPIYRYSNNLQNFSGSQPTEAINEIDLPPRFFMNTETFEPDLTSPLVGTGTNPCGQVCPFPTPFKNDWSHPTYDIKGQLREQGSRIDMGAVESVHEPDLIFWDLFE